MEYHPPRCTGGEKRKKTRFPVLFSVGIMILQILKRGRFRRNQSRLNHNFQFAIVSISTTKKREKHTMKKIIVCLLFLSVSAHAEMYKCEGKDGKKTYQQTPCKTDAKQSEIKPAAKVKLADQIAAIVSGAQDSKDAELIHARNNHQLMPGMSKEMAIEAIGSPSKINHSQYGQTRNEQWVYYRYAKGKLVSTSYVYFENDVLTSMQW